MLLKAFSLLFYNELDYLEHMARQSKQSLFLLTGQWFRLQLSIHQGELIFFIDHYQVTKSFEIVLEIRFLLNLKVHRDH